MKTISIRQPWAHGIIYLGKPIENRVWPTKYRGPILIHAAKGMTKDEYEDFCDFVKFDIGALEIPPFDALKRGGIIGQADLVDCVTKHSSPWFVGPYGFVLENPMPLPFTPLRGALGIFDVDDWRTE
jgi:hypothetical protein